MKEANRKKHIAVIGAGKCDEEIGRMAEEVGWRLAKSGIIVICGGLGGVMEYAARGAKNGDGQTIGILPGYDPAEANLYIDIPILTGLGHARNVIVVGSADAVIAVGGEYGTLSEIAFAVKLGKPVIALKSWHLRQSANIKVANTPELAVVMALQAIHHELPKSKFSGQS